VSDLTDDEMKINSINIVDSRSTEPSTTQLSTLPYSVACVQSKVANFYPFCFIKRRRLLYLPNPNTATSVTTTTNKKYYRNNHQTSTTGLHPEK
jgi:hypothetical protein